MKYINLIQFKQNKWSENKIIRIKVDPESTTIILNKLN